MFCAELGLKIKKISHVTRISYQHLYRRVDNVNNRYLCGSINVTVGVLLLIFFWINEAQVFVKIKSGFRVRNIKK